MEERKTYPKFSKYNLILCSIWFVVAILIFFLYVIAFYLMRATTSRTYLDLNQEGDLNSDRISERNKDITAIPAIYKGRLYYPRNGYLYAVNPMGGAVVWEKNLKELTGLTPAGLVENYENFTVSVSTPEVACGLLIVGIYGPAVVIAVNISTGEPVWSTQLSSHAASVIAMSGIVHQGAFYVGTSCLEERLGSEKCCTFRGSLAKLDASTGAILWQTYMLPENGALVGASLSGSRPAIDIFRKHIYVATGKSYSAPPPQQETKNQTVPESAGATDYSDSVLAVDLCNGEVIWSNRLFGSNDRFLECGDGPAPSSSYSNLAYDFVGEVSILLDDLQINETARSEVVEVTHKRGHRWILECDTGKSLEFIKPDVKAWLAQHGVF